MRKPQTIALACSAAIAGAALLFTAQLAATASNATQHAQPMSTGKAANASPTARKAVAPASNAATDTRSVDLKHLGSIKLGGDGDDANQPTIHDVDDFAIDGRGRFGFLNGCGCKQSMLLVDGNGTILRTIKLPEPADKDASSRHAAWLGGDQWIVTASGYDATTQSSALRVDVGTGATTPIAGFASPRIRAIAGTRDGGFVVLAEVDGFLGSRYMLSAFDGKAKRRWTVDPRAGEGSGMSHPTGIAVTSSRTIVVLESFEKKLRILDSNGHALRALDLDRAWGRSDSFPDRIHADANGGVVVTANSGKSSVLRVSLDGKPIASWSPAFPDGRRFAIHGGVQVAPDGKAWTSDGYALLRLDGKGVVDRVVGEKFDPDRLGSVAKLVVTPRGSIYALDERTHAVHVFDGNGQRLHVDRPAPTDNTGDSFTSSLTITDAGDVYVSLPEFEGMGDHARPKSDFLHYSPSGIRTGVKTIGLDDEHARRLIAQPGTGNLWALGTRSIHLVDAGGKLLHKLDRTADGRNIGFPISEAVAPDGSLAVTSAVESFGLVPMRGPSFLVTIVSSNGNAVATWPVPKGTSSYSRSVAYDGKRLAFLDKMGEDDHRKFILLTDARGKPQYRFQLPADSSASQVFFVKQDGQNELWIHDDEKTIDRYLLQ